MTKDEGYMQRCIELALNGAGHVSPNPLVGAVIVQGDTIIGEGWHRQYGQAHAEVNAVNDVAGPSLLAGSTVYVNLEPCSHYGKTPPCADLLIRSQVGRVVIGMQDPFAEVNGSGIRKLREAGIEVEMGVLQAACEELNKRFITFHTKKRPYIILKWAQTADGFIAPDARTLSAEEFERKRHITGFTVQKLVHKWRTEEDAIMVGTHTAHFDNPALNARAWEGPQPLRITLDRELRLPKTHKLFDRSQRTIIFTARQVPSSANPDYVQLDFLGNVPQQVTEALYARKVQSLIIEGGTHTLQNFIKQDLWDEAQVFTSPASLGEGIAAPVFHGRLTSTYTIDNKTLQIYRA